MTFILLLDYTFILPRYGRRKTSGIYALERLKFCLEPFIVLKFFWCLSVIATVSSPAEFQFRFLLIRVWSLLYLFTNPVLLLKERNMALKLRCVVPN